MNSSIQTNLTTMGDLSILIIKAVYPWNVTLACISSLQLMTSALILTIILATKNLRQNQTFVMLAHVALNDTISAIEDLVASSMKIGDYHSGMPNPSTVRDCAYKDLPRLIFYTNSNGFLFLLAVNRLVSVCCPLWYQGKVCHRLFNVLMGIIYLRTALNMILFIGGITDEWVPLCGYLPMTNWSTRLLALMVVLWTSAIAIIYTGAVLITYAKLGQVRKQLGNVDQARQQLQVHVVWTLALILIIHVVTSAFGSVMIVAVWSTRASNALQLNYIAFICSKTLIALSSTLYFPVLYTRCTDFRMAFGKVVEYLKQSNSSVGPLMLV